MNKKYDDFQNIKLEDTGLMKKNDIVYNRLVKNEISNLKELFELDNLDKIYYGTITDITSRHGHLQTKGVVKLLRTKYLNEDLPYKDILERTFSNDELISNGDNKNNFNNFVNTFLSMGFSFNFIISIRDNTKNINSKKVLELLEDAYEDKIKICCNKPEYEMNKRRLSIILEWYYRKDLKSKPINNLQLLKERVIKLKDIEDKKREYILAKIELERLISLKGVSLKK